MDALLNTHERVLKLMLSPQATLLELVALIGLDETLCARLLQVANSSYYSVPGGVSEIAKALEYVGFQTVIRVLLTSQENLSEVME